MAAYTARHAAQRYRVHRTTILYWHSHGWLDNDGTRHHLNPVGYNDAGALLFDELELVQAEHETRSKRQRSHRASRRILATV